MIESAAAQWKPRNGPEAAADFFSSLSKISRSSQLATAGKPRIGLTATKKMSIKAPCPPHFSKIENSTGDPSPTPYKTSLFTEQTNRK